jgi:PAS domain S-box-containing protein
LSTTTASDAPVHWAAAFVLTALAYGVAGLLALSLAFPPGYASPLYPAAGVALASLLVFGRRMLPAIALGSFGVNLSLALSGQPLGMAELALPLIIAGGAALQAFVGAALVRRSVSSPLSLSAPREVLAFMLAGMTSCLVNATIASLGMWLTHKIGMADLPIGFAVWWTGDALGVLIGAPIALTLIGRPRSAWAPRMLSVGLTLALVTVLVALGIRQIVQWNNERAQRTFEHDATSAALMLEAKLREPLAAVEAMYSVFVASNEVTPQEMRLATQSWLRGADLQAIGWSERVPRDEVPAFEARVRAAGASGYAVFDRQDGASLAKGDADVMAIRYIEPLASNAAALGLNQWSIPAARSALEEARRSGMTVASSSFRLTQQGANEPQAGVVLYRVLYASEGPEKGEARNAPLRGAVWVTLRMDKHLGAFASHVPAYLQLCLLDVSPGAPIRRLAGASGCETRTDSDGTLQLTHALAYGGRQWEVHVSAVRTALPTTAGGADVWLFALVGLLSTATLGGFLLTMTGRTHRIESAVLERTAALRSEVHERGVAEAALRESEQRFRNILNHVPIGVVYTDLRGMVKQANPKFCELTGYSEQELLTMGLSDFTHPEDMQRDAELMGQLVRGEIPIYRRHDRYLAKSGSTMWVQATVSLLHFADGSPRSIVGAVEDITEHLKLEEAERAREAAEASNRAKSEFLSRMSHELRTPLNAMLGFAQLLELDPREPLKTAQQQWVSQIQQAGWHLLEMINDVLDLSRIESGNLRLTTKSLDLTELLDSTESLIEGEARQRGIRISRQIAPGATMVLGDATRVKQILTNLLSNAVKYNADGGRIHIGSRLLDADRVEIAVTDTGLGLTPEQLRLLFQPFNRLGRERSAQQGTGIGLVISQRLAELMGGSLRATSVAGQGSSFILTLQCAAAPDTVRSDLDGLAAEPAAYHRRIVHYVEDNETNVEVMRGILARRPQVELHVSVTGLDGLAAIRAHRPDLILLDMHLPDISGMELLRHLKSDPQSGDIPIVVVSADALPEQIAAAFKAGCQHYLTKPVSVSELLAVLDDHLDRLETRHG